MITEILVQIGLDGAILGAVELGLLLLGAAGAVKIWEGIKNKK